MYTNCGSITTEVSEDNAQSNLPQTAACESDSQLLSSLSGEIKVFNENS